MTRDASKDPVAGRGDAPAAGTSRGMVPARAPADGAGMDTA